MKTHTDQPKKNNSAAAANHASKQHHTGAPGLVNAGHDAIAQRKLQDMADNSLRAKQLKAYQAMANGSSQVKQLKALQQVVNGAVAVVQRFVISDKEEYGGYLAGDHELRDPDNVASFVTMLNNDEEIPNYHPMTAAKNLDMVKETDEEKGWQYISKTEYDKTKEAGAKEPEVVKKNVLLDGHHRFVAHVEAGKFDKLPAIGDAAEGAVNHGYHWNKLTGI